MKSALFLGVVVSFGLVSAAPAQDTSQFAGALAAGVEGFGQSVGEAEKGGSSIFVTATGRAELPAPIAEAYLINIEGRSGSAVEAYKLREDRLKSARAIAQKFDVEVDI